MEQDRIGVRGMKRRVPPPTFPEILGISRKSKQPSLPRPVVVFGLYVTAIGSILFLALGVWAILGSGGPWEITRNFAVCLLLAGMFIYLRGELRRHKRDVR